MADEGQTISVGPLGGVAVEVESAMADATAPAARRVSAGFADAEAEQDVARGLDFPLVVFAAWTLALPLALLPALPLTV